MNIRNEDVKELIAEIPDGHKHLRTTLVLHDGSEFTFQEATIANLVRAYITVRTHPNITRIKLEGRKVDRKKIGFAEWQLLEQETCEQDS